jgi:hypothetical protein
MSAPRENWHADANDDARAMTVCCSVQPGEDWSWCYVDKLMFRVEAA